MIEIRKANPHNPNPERIHVKRHTMWRKIEAQKQARAGRLTKLKVDEVSLVTKGANPFACIALIR